MHGKEFWAKSKLILDEYPDVEAIYLPNNNGNNGYGMAPVFALAPFVISEEVLCYVDDDVGVGNPAKIATLGTGIFDITYRYDDLALQYISVYPACKYLFLSSGAAYCSTFDQPADEKTKANLDINHIKPQDWYGVAKLYAECRHRALPQLPIVDIRVFNYFSHTQDMSARFLITDIIRAIKDKSTLETSSHFTTRDYLHSDDFYQLINLILVNPACNTVVDCYSQQPIGKLHLLDIMQKEFGLVYKVEHVDRGIAATGNKPNYFSQNKKAEIVFKYAPAYSSEKTLLEQTKLIGGFPCTSYLNPPITLNGVNQ